MKQAYPTFIVRYGKDYLVYVPDMDIYTEGKSVAGAIEMARDAIGLKGIDFEDDRKPVPEASSYENAILLAKKDTEDIDYTEGMLTLVDVDFTEYRKRKDNKMIRRNVTLPGWLNALAEKENLNVSGVLQEALMKKLGVSR